MIKLEKKSVVDNMVTFDIEIEGNLYSITFDISKKYKKWVKTTVPEYYKIYRGQARIAVDRYFGKELPDVIYSETH